jgi:hypothetical protein
MLWFVDLFAVVLDRLKSKWREHLFHKESLKRLRESDGA